MEMKQNEKSFHGTYLNRTAYLFFILKHLNDFQNRNFSVLWLKCTQTMEMKQNQTFFQGTYSNLTLFSLVVKYLNISMNFIIGTFQSHCKSEHNQVKCIKITRNMCKCDSIFYSYKVVHCLNAFWNLFFDKVYH